MLGIIFLNKLTKIKEEKVMVTEKWETVNAINNMGEASEDVGAKRTKDGNIILIYAAYGGVKAIELNAIADVCSILDTGKSEQDVQEAVGDDYEIAIPVVVNGDKVMLVIDCNDEIKLLTDKSYENVPEVQMSDTWDAEDFEELSYEDEYDGALDCIGLG